MRKGRRDSPWTKAYRQASFLNARIKFKRMRVRSTGVTRRLSADWVPVYFADADMSPEAWIDQMIADGVEDVVRHIHVREPESRHVEIFRRDVETEAMTISVMDGDPMLIPMSRGSCDGPFTPCPFQYVCYK